MADLNRDQLQRLARLGALSRLEELRREEAAIRKSFPDLFRGGPSTGSGQGPSARGAVRRRRGGMSAAARKAQSERMTRYWAERRKAKAAAK